MVGPYLPAAAEQEGRCFSRHPDLGPRAMGPGRVTGDQPYAGHSQRRTPPATPFSGCVGREGVERVQEAPTLDSYQVGQGVRSGHGQLVQDQTVT